MENDLARVKKDGRPVYEAVQDNYDNFAACAFAPRSDWSGMGVLDHFVQFYEADGSLLDSLSGFIAAGLSAGEGCVVVAKKAHRDGLEERLRATGLDLSGARACGQFITLDAVETLSKFFVDGRPEPDRFREVVGDIIGRSAEGRGRVRVFGDMVAHLCGEGRHAAAVHLEELWNDLQKTQPFSLFCAYPMNNFDGMTLGAALSEVCTTHTAVIPAESYTALDSTDDRLRVIIQLQQKARLLEAEVAEREQLLAREQAARAEAERANRLKDEFLATVSHELRTPLTAIVGWTHILRTGQLDEHAADRALATIERNARSQTQIVEDLLDVSRIITGKLRLDVQPINPDSFIESAIEAVRPAAEAKGVRIQKVIDTGAGAIVGDPARLQQVVWNLLSNAIKFTPRGGRVQARLECVDSHALIVVSDTGKGIEPEFLPYVFERFRQADMSTTRIHGGLGLGLAIVRHLVELHGGTVLAESSGEGQGTTFTVSLPLVSVYRREGDAERAHPAEADIEPPAQCPESLEGVKVLVVDDEADTRELLKTMLGQCGAMVTTAGSAQEALDSLEQAIPDVLVSDIGMPGEDGYDLIRKVRALPRERGGKVSAVALTAYARTEDRLRAIRAGFQIHVPKPVELNELVTMIASLVERSENSSNTTTQPFAS